MMYRRIPLNLIYAKANKFFDKIKVRSCTALLPHPKKLYRCQNAKLQDQIVVISFHSKTIPL